MRRRTTEKDSISLLKSIDQTLKRIEKQEKNVMSTQAELNEAIDALAGKVKEVFDEMNKAFARLQAKIDSGAGTADLSAELAKVTDISAKLAEAVADAQGETPAAEG